MRGAGLSRYEGFFRSIKDEFAILDDRESVGALVEQVGTLHHFVIIDDLALGIAEVAQVEGNTVRIQARQLYVESLHLKVSVMDKAGITYGIEAFAQLAASQKQFQHAVVLWGAGEQLHQALNLLLPPSREKIYRSLLLEARSQLREAEFEAAWAEGQAMNMQEAIQYASRV
jgi:hypothetical protein